MSAMRGKKKSEKSFNQPYVEHETRLDAFFNTMGLTDAYRLFQSVMRCHRYNYPSAWNIQFDEIQNALNCNRKDPK